MKFLKKCASIYKAFEIGLMITLFAIAFFIIVLQVISRFVMGQPLPWTDESSTVLQMIITFWGIGYGIRMRKHIRVDGLYNKLPQSARYIVNLFSNIAFIVVCVVCIRISMMLVDQVWNVHFGTFNIDRGKVFLLVPISFAISIVYCAMDVIDDFLRIVHKNPVFRLGMEVKENES